MCLLIGDGDTKPDRTLVVRIQWLRAIKETNDEIGQSKIIQGDVGVVFEHILVIDIFLILTKHEELIR
jgi:hypothetical protein